jgi:hypothetical protein
VLQQPEVDATQGEADLLLAPGWAISSAFAPRYQLEYLF